MGLRGELRRLRRWGFATAFGVVVGLLCAAPAAEGATVTYAAEERLLVDGVFYRAAPGEVNKVRFYHDSALHERLRMVNLTDGTTVITPGAYGGEITGLATTLTQCVLAPVSAAYCRFRDVSNYLGRFSVTAFLGDGPDLGRVSYVAHNGYALLFQLYGEGGNDHLIGTPETDFFEGGPGTDRIIAGAGNDTVSGYDREFDWVDCGAGVDRVDSADPVDELIDCENVTFHAAN